MRNFFSLFFFVTLSFFSFAQVKNVNPNISGEPWLLGGLRIPSTAELSKIPEFQSEKNFSAKNLPTSLDNSTQPYFRPIFNQDHGSCAQASGIGYAFTYEMNRARGTSANSTSTQYPSHYTYNFLNSGNGNNGSWYQDGWDIIRANGCPTVVTYGGMAISDTHWMSGFAKYESAFANRLTDYFSIDVSAPEGLSVLKHWFYDHLDGSAVGGVANFAAGISIDDYYLDGNIVTKWGYSVNHAMTFVGWDDNVEYDFSGDGNITNDVDINGDQIVDMRDWERGALVMVNSWGTGWAAGGKAYVMYKLLAEPVSNGGIFEGKVYAINVRENYSPHLTMKVKMSHNSRENIKIRAGISTDLNATLPDHIIEFPLFNRQGGAYDMLGNWTSDPIEVAFDITPLLSFVNSEANAKYFLMVTEYDYSDVSSGEILSFSVKNSENEFVSDSHNVQILNNSTTYLSVNAVASFDSPAIANSVLTQGAENSEYSEQLTASGGNAPYSWSILSEFTEFSSNETFPAITENALAVTNEDDGFGEQTLEFDFPFYGNTYRTLYPLTDGSIVFVPEFNYLRTEEALKSTKMIAVFASDLWLIPAYGHGIFYSGDAQSATFRWKTTAWGNENASVDVAVKLYADGTVEMFYGDGIVGAVGASGISNGDGINYTISSNSNSELPSNKAFLYEPEPFPIGMNFSQDGIFYGTPLESGSWDIRFSVRDFNNISKSKTLNFSVISSEIQSVSNTSFTVYPNPAKNVVIFDFGKTIDSDVKISIFDITGRPVVCLQNSINRNEVSWKIPQNQPNGIYFCETEISGHKYRRKFIISK